jgi:sugar/nucleoside kinase (ribokinase family)
MNTFLGACVNLAPDDIEPDLIRSAQVTYLEGYLYDEPHAKAAFHKAAEIAHGAGRKVALSLSDTFCVLRHHADFLQLVDHHVDVLFGNELEMAALLGTTTIDEAVDRLRTLTDLAIVTRDARGSIIVTADAVVHVEAVPTTVVDATGAGDAYAAGFLYGLTRALPLAECGHIGSTAAAEMISHIGARRL